MQEKLFQRCTHFLYSSVLSLGGKVNTYKTDVIAWHGIHFHKNNLWNILVIGNYYVNFQNYQNWMLLTSSDTKRTLMHLFLFTNSAQRELVLIYVRRVYTTAISFPCISTLPLNQSGQTFFSINSKGRGAAHGGVFQGVIFM